MRVTCEHCGAQYKLDQQQIVGRGVRITCPNCSHVFTVYRSALESQDIEATVGGDSSDAEALDISASSIRSAPRIPFWGAAGRGPVQTVGTIHHRHDLRRKAGGRAEDAG